MPKLYDKESGRLIGTISQTDLDFLMVEFEEESSDDQDYYIDQATIDMIADGQATDHLLQLLRTALGTAEGVDIRWQRR